MKFFYRDLALEVPEGIYFPREDSLLMAESVERALMRPSAKKLLELGCGSGFLSILAATRGADVVAADINPDAVETASMNAAKNNVEIKSVQSDLFERISGKFDVIVFNPPYLPADPEEKYDNDITYSGGMSGRDTIARFIADVPEHLEHNGKVLLLISSLTGESAVIKLFRSAGMSAKPILRKKIEWEELIVLEARSMA